MNAWKFFSPGPLACLTAFVLTQATIVVDLHAQATAPRPEKAYLRWEWAFKQRVFPLNEMPLGARERALEQIRRSREGRLLAEGSGGIGHKWINIGPAPIANGQTEPPSPVSGRVADIAVDPGNLNHWLIGAAQGGIWETWDAGVTWKPKTDDQASLAMGGIAFAPSHPQIIYAGTGEAQFSGDSFSGGGLLKSTNGGTNWSLLATATFSQTSFSDLKVHPGDSNTVWAATTRGIAGQVASATNIPPLAPPRGIFKSTDGGMNWTRTLTGEATDLEIDPSDFNRQFAALGEIYGSPTNGLYRSTDAGETWQYLGGPWTNYAGGVGRVELALAPSNPNTLYVSVAAIRQPGQNTPLTGIWRTDNAWAGTPTFSIMSQPPGIGTYMWYYHETLVDPSNADVLYVGGLNLLKRSGNSWQNVIHDMHVDQHTMAWAGTRLIVGNDGGVWSSVDGGNSWSNHNATLSITQFYDGSVHPSNPYFAIGAAQDNGTELWIGNDDWDLLLGGDGADNGVSSSNPDFHWFISVYGLQLLRTLNGGADNFDNQTTKTAGIILANAPFIARVEKSTGNDDLLIAGTDNLWRCNNFFSALTPSWSSNGPDMVDTDGEPTGISALAFAPSDATGDTYAYGTEDGQLRLTSNGGGNWKNIDANGAVPERYITDLAFDPSDADILYVTLSGFDEGTPGKPGHVFKTVNALAVMPSWNNVGPTFNFPHNTIVVHPGNPALVYVGTDIGVWESANGGGSWTHLGPETGMPNVAVFELQINGDGRPVAFTHGRGAFVSKPAIPEIIPDEVACRPPCRLWWIHPGDLVSIDFILRNAGVTKTKNLKGTLQQTSSVTPYTRQQTYGEIPAGGHAVKSYSFTANGPCCDVITATLDLDDDGVSLGTATFRFQLGRPRTALFENFDSVARPNLPTGWTATLSGAATSWSTVSNGFDTFPTAAFAPSPGASSDNILYSPVFPVVTPGAKLSFRHYFELERAIDGGVLEIAIGTTPFDDILRAGGAFTSNGYTAIITGAGPLAGRMAWTGDAIGMKTTKVNLPPSAAGQNVQLRWRCVTEGRLVRAGWFVDTIAVDEFECPNPIGSPFLLRPTLTGNLFQFSFDAVRGRTFVVEYENSLNESNWQTLQTILGNGSIHTITDRVDRVQQRFFRFRAE